MIIDELLQLGLECFSSNLGDLKAVYKAATLMTLDDLGAKWGDKYPLVIASWRNKWPTLSAYFVSAVIFVCQVMVEAPWRILTLPRNLATR